MIGEAVREMVREHLAVLLVVVPLIAAPLCVIFPFRRFTWALAMVATLAALGAALSLIATVQTSGPVVYELGDWAAPWGIEYRIDMLSAYLAVLVTVVATVVLFYAPRSLAREIRGDRMHLFHGAFLLNLTGLLGITVTGDAFNLFVFLEISSLSSYALIAMGEDRRALTAAFRYLVMGTVGATFYVIGVGLMYMMTGTLNIADLATRLPEVMETRTVLVALAFLVVGIGLKLALFPLHTWLPNAYTYAPSVVSAFLAATATKVAIYVLLRVLFTIYGAETIAAMPIATPLMVLAILAMFVGSGVAIYQPNAKRLLAYSSVAQIGYIVLGISFLSVTGLTGGILHLFNHALIKSALFLVMGCVFLRIGSVQIADMAGLGRRMPWTMAAFVVGGLSLIGTPLTVGFVSKWYLIRASLEAGAWPIAFLVVASSLLAMIYVWRVVEYAYFRGHPDAGATIEEAPWTMLVPVWVLIAANVYFGINTGPTIGAARAAAEALLGGGP